MCIRDRLSTLKSMAEGGNISAPPAPTPKPKAGKSIDTLVKEVLQGMWGNGQARFDALKRAGYDPDIVQNAVNMRVLGTTSPVIPKASKTPLEVAREVLRGDWGVGSDRVASLTNAGYNYNEVQAEVNRLCGLKVPTGKTVSYTHLGIIMAGKVKKHQIALFLNFGTAQAPKYVRIKKSTELTLNFDPQTEDYDYIADESPTTDLERYAPKIEGLPLTMYKGCLLYTSNSRFC